MVDVFISYSRANQAAVRILAEAITDLGYDIWWDDELPPHKSYSEVITEKIGEARAAVVVWSDSAAKSEWVRAEADVARNQKKLVQAAIGDDVLPPMPFNQIQVASLEGWNGEAAHSGWRKIQASLLDLCGPPQTTPQDDSRVAYVMPKHAPPRQPDVTSGQMEQVHVDEPGGEDVDDMTDISGQDRRMKIGIGAGVLVFAVALLAFLFWPVGDDISDIADSDIEEGEPDTSRFVDDAVINDRDGWTNVRSGPSTSDAIITRVVEGEIFQTFEQNGDWWEVQLLDGRIGYMNRSLIELLNESGDDEEVVNVDPVLENLQFVSPRIIIPDSNSRAISNMEIADLDALELRLARNEIFARKGYIFKNARLRAWFEQFDWYNPDYENVTLNRLELDNVDRLKAAEEQFQ